MKSIRVYELAKELDTSSSEVLEVLQEELNLDVTSHMNTVNEQVAARVRQLLTSPEQEEEPATEAAPETVETPEEPQVDPSDKKQKVEERQEEEKASKEILVTGPITVGDLAAEMEIPATRAVQRLMSMGVMAAINQRLEPETAAELADQFGYDVIIEAEDPFDTTFDETIEEEEDPALLEPRAPVVTVLGHVDHGKTTLLDAIRETKVTEQEAGGITQHIGASRIVYDSRDIVFIDTPGHEAFTAMRSRGAQVTDIVILVVAADDGVMPQTVEAINHAKEAEVPIVVAINKMDLPQANPNRVKQQLTEHGLVPEEWGGDTVCVEISALRREGLNELLELLALLADLEELQANPQGPAKGTVIESEMDRGRGPLATVLIRRGTLRLGDAFVVGLTWGTVRAMVDDTGRQVEKAAPSTAVEIMGLSDVPEAGDILRVVEDKSEAREIADGRQSQYRERELEAKSAVSLDAFYRQAQDTGDSVLRLGIKADVNGTLEALISALEGLGNEEVGVEVIHGGVGPINESDIMLAAASEAVVVGFNVRPDTNARSEAEENHVEIRTYTVIYDAIREIEAALEGLLEPEYEEVVVGRAEVRDTFQVPQAGTVAGLYVLDGEMRRSAKARVIRDGMIIHEAEIDSLKRFEDDVSAVQSGYECGLKVAGFDDVQLGDIIEAVEEREVPRTL